jgi:hypothetical protein
MSGGTERSGFRTLLACGLTWMFPGAGHAFLGHWKRGLAFFAIIVSMAVLGLVERGNLSLVHEHAPNLTRLQVLVNLALGPAEPMLRRGLYGELVYDRRPRTPQVRRFMRVHKQRGIHPGSPFGTAYLWTAGLMNMLLVLDAFDLSRCRKE